ncbi:MAG TPA: recombination mediator RecR [Acidobacteriaceae bacterium]|nr:recombination mediator RecR [Terriglobia bacterium]HVC90997.1 recombination mediator RecR [Acidobacteriaceae bacterium]
MSRFAQPLDQLIEELSKLPGIGRKSAQRLSFHILRATEQDAFALADAIRDLKAQLHLCSICYNITDVDPCQFCSSPARNQAIICVVEEASNIASIERTKHFNGAYHVLHGTLSPLNGIGPEQLRIDSLLKRARNGTLQEVILATNPTVEGEATAGYLLQLLRAMPIRITRIATGIPAGADIEYADEVTMTRAMEGRREI